MELINKIIRDEEGQSMVEYSLIVAAVALVCVAGYNTLGKNVNDMVGKISKKVGELGKNVN
ncbi:Flp/Fap pilin component [compost metagenome]|jgi:Flp pilus assembly protein, pilin Flp